MMDEQKGAELMDWEEIADFYGLKHQTKKTIEELGELIAALVGGDEEDIIEGLADVKLMTMQVEYLMDISDKIEDMVGFKTKRTLAMVHALKKYGHERWEWN